MRTTPCNNAAFVTGRHVCDDRRDIREGAVVIWVTALCLDSCIFDVGEVASGHCHAYWRQARGQSEGGSSKSVHA